MAEVAPLSVCVIDVENTHTNGLTFWYDLETGRPVGRVDNGPAPRLVPYDDPTANELRAKSQIEGSARKRGDSTSRKHRDYRNQMTRLLAKLPGTDADWEAAYDLLDDWEEFSLSASAEEKAAG